MAHPPQPPLPAKKEVALALLERSSVYIHLDPRGAAVAVPAWFKKQPRLVLQIGLNMPVPIPDLRLDDERLSCTLSFNRVPFHCVVPWKSVFAMADEDAHGMVWPDDVPPEVAREAQGAARKEGAKLASVPDSKSNGVKKRTRKPRAPLAAVPEPRAREAKEPEARAAAAAAAADDDDDVVASPAPQPSEPSVSSRKPKREIPPYLRVVK